MNSRTALFWSVRREIWENRSIYIAPLAVAVLIVITSAISAGSGWHATVFARQGAIDQPYEFAALLLMLTTLLVGIVYCLDSLYGERRDRSILFWKSLPVSDVMTVLAKASIPVVVLPLITFIVTAVTQVLMLAMAGARFSHTGLNEPFGQSATGLFVHLVLGHGFWYAPIWGWLLFCSAWARRVPYLWATLPLLVLGLLERLAFNTSHFVEWLTYRFAGGPAGAPPAGETMGMSSITSATMADFFMSRGLWTGLALFALFVAAAVQLRRNRGPM